MLSSWSWNSRKNSTSIFPTTPPRRSRPSGKRSNTSRNTNLDRMCIKRRVVVTGLGAVTSLSLKVEDLWQRVLRGESGIHALRLFDTTRYKVKFAGDIYDWSPTDYISAREEKRLDRFTQLALVA